MDNNNLPQRKRPFGAERPYPWRCRHCWKDEVYPKTTSFTAQLRRGGSLHSFTIPALDIPTCQNCGERLFTEVVDEQINRAWEAHEKAQSPHPPPGMPEPMADPFPGKA